MADSTPVETDSRQWLEHTCQVEVPTSIHHVWDLWSNLALMPNWMKWIRSVELLDDSHSKWTLDTRGFTFTWTSLTHTVHHHQIIAWKSIDGLPNRGALRFYDRKGSTIVKLSIAYALPGFLAKLMDNVFVKQVVESTLQADLERFRVYALEHAGASHES
ncbi:MAG: SRPBCC family protein [Synechococcales cyanobacterium]